MIDFWLKLWRLIGPYRVRFVIGTIFGGLGGMADTVVLVTVFFVVSLVFSDSDQATLAKINQINQYSPWLADLVRSAFTSIATHVHASNVSLFLAVSLIPIVMLARGIVNYLGSYLMGWVATRTVADLRARLFEHLLNLPLGFLTRISTGELMSRVNDVGVLQTMFAGSMITMIKEPVNIATLIFTAFALFPWLTLVALGTVPLCAIPIYVYNKKVRKAGAAIQTEAASLNNMMHEAFTGNRIIKGYGLEGVVMERFLANQNKFNSHYMRVVRSTETPGPMIEFFGAIGIAIVLFHLGGRTSPVKFGVFIAAIITIYRPIKAVIRTQSQLNQTKAATERVFELLATKSNLIDPPNPLPLVAAGADIEFDHVNFKYDEKPIIIDFNLRVEPGQMIALVGSSGSGKTTITNLLLRFYDPVSGAIRIGGKDLRSVALRDVRSQLAVVTQDVILFNESVRRNIGYGRAGATFDEIQEAARHAFCHDFIVQKKGGYDFVVGEKGANLSGGERQRVAIARAILKNAPILILDEATSSLDNESERAVQAALDELMKGRTTFCVAHRLSTIQRADLILVMSHGRIVETGRHAELLARGGVYKNLHALGIEQKDRR